MKISQLLIIIGLLTILIPQAYSVFRGESRDPGKRIDTSQLDLTNKSAAQPRSME